MNIDDIIYLSCLIICIAIGGYFRSIKDNHQRKIYSTILGVLIVIIVSGIHALHCFISATICALIIIYSHPSKCFLRSFIFMFGYLVFFRTTYYFGIPDPPGHTNMIQMILTLKATGIASEINNVYKKLTENKSTETEQKSDENKEQDELTEYEIELQNIKFSGIFYYLFNYIGVLIGPYYRYRTYSDYYKMPFKNHADCLTPTIQKLKLAAIFILIYLPANYIWPLSYMTSNEFYQDRSFWYRLFYIWPTYLVFRMRIYAGLTLSECICIYAGFGAYPDESDPDKGEGPKKQYSHMIRNPENYNYNFKTVHNLDALGVETCLTFRESIKYWNICIQYWLAVNVYKRFPSKKYRTLATLFVSSFWHGFYPGHYFCLMGAPFYIPVEDIYYKKIYQKYINYESIRKILYGIIWFSRFFTTCYLCAAFVLLKFNRIWYFYSSVYHVGYICYIIMLILAIFLKKMDKSKNKKNIE